MSNRPTTVLITLAVYGLAFLAGLSPVENPGRLPAAADNDWFMAQRTYPNTTFSPHQYYDAVARGKARPSEPAGMFSEIAWNSVGPENIGGRITSLALHPTNSDIIYAGAAAGGVWKSIDGAVTWTNIFNEAPATGSLILDPNDPEIVYVGTGEGNPAGVATYPGNGIWRSTDGGSTWDHSGLELTGSIGRLAMHPSAPGRIFAATLGLYRSRTQERGLYRSTNSGLTWERVLFVNDTTGACDVVIDPGNPERIYAATWTRHRPITYSIISGTGSGLWISSDGGDSWSLVTSGFPFNDPTLGRTSLAVSASSSGVVYALTTNTVSPRGIYRSTNSGTSWNMVAGSSPFGGEGQVWYNNVLAVHPIDPNTVIAGMTDIYRTTNGGTSWSSVLGFMHVDQHAVEFDPMNPTRVVAGNDGGVFVSTNAGLSWTKSYNLPISQFYAGTIDASNPDNYYGGTQDNGTLRTLTGSTNDWSLIYGGDGFYVLVDPVNPLRIYAESQWGGLGYSTNGGFTFQNGRTSGFGTNDRTNWNTPIAMDLSNPLTLYVGTYRVFRTTNGMQSWSSISGDLTRGVNGRIGTITTIDVSQTDPDVIFAGTDDGKVSVTLDGGGLWTDVTGNLPDRWVTRVSIDPEFSNIAYVTQSGYLQYDPGAHIHRTTDFGQTWTPVDGDLPDLPVNDILVDPDVRPYLYAGTDAGVLYSTNGGVNWLSLGTGLPAVPVHDLTFHRSSRTLLASTHGRSSWTIDLTSLVAVEPSGVGIPRTFSLGQNYPNPFNPGTIIRYTLGSETDVRLTIHDLLGRMVTVLINERQTEGDHSVGFDASGLPSGVYLYTLEAGSFVQTRKLTLLR